jgi:antitoxin component of RelBE/YafQ-DinJ toxin-antitoxin module
MTAAHQRRAAAIIGPVTHRPDLKEGASAALWLTTSGVVCILLTRIADEGALPFPPGNRPAAHDARFRFKVQQADSNYLHGRKTTAMRSSPPCRGRSNSRSVQ